MAKSALKLAGSLRRSASKAGKTVATGVLLGTAAVVNAAPVELPATATADATGSATNGGTFMITVVLVVVGFGIIVAMAKRAK